MGEGTCMWGMRHDNRVKIRVRVGHAVYPIPTGERRVPENNPGMRSRLFLSYLMSVR